ncbi:hypothetical protein ACW9KT_15675 [Hymenobacter sp. HD11105]
MEEQNKDLIVALMMDEPLVLSGEQQLMLASWIGLMTIVAEFTDIPTHAIPFRERQYFLDHKRPPSDWVIWIGKHQFAEASSWGWRYLHYGFRMEAIETTGSELGGIVQKVADENNVINCNIQSSTFCVNGFAFIALSATDVNNKRIISGFDIPSMVKIWPPTNTDVPWSSVVAMTDADLEYQSGALYYFFKGLARKTLLDRGIPG